jgi:hypothetical protein
VDKWDTETTAEREHVPIWLVEFTQLWTTQSATNNRYQEEYQQVRRLARSANVPPFVIMLRMFRDTYQITETSTREQFKQAMDKQVAADGGQMYLKLASIPTEEAQRAAYAQELEEKVAKAVEAMKEAINADDDAKFQEASAISGQSQEMWLIVAQQMTPKQARLIIVDFAQNEVTRWMEEQRPGPPPLIFERYKKET